MFLSTSPKAEQIKRRREINNLFSPVMQLVQELLSLKQDEIPDAEDRASDAKEALEAFSEQRSAGASTSAFGLCWVVATIIVDIVVLGPTIEWLVSMAWPGHPFLATATKFLVPVAILTVEVGLGHFLAKAWDEGIRKDKYGQFTVLGFLALLMVSFMPALTFATQTARIQQMMLEGGAAWPFWLQTASLTALALVLHAGALVMGKNIVEALQGAGLRLRKWRADRKLRRLKTRRDELQNDLHQHALELKEKLNSYNNKADERKQISTAGRLPARIVRFLEDRGYPLEEEDNFQLDLDIPPEIED